MEKSAPATPRLRVASLRPDAPVSFDLRPDAPAREALADALGLSALRKLRFAGTLAPQGKDGWLLEAELGATVVQPCSVTLDPVTTRIDDAVSRRYLPAHRIDTPAPGDEVEMPEDDTVEPLSDIIDLDAVMAEALALSLPAYPRKEGLDAVEIESRPAGAAPIDSAAQKPFAGLAALRDRLKDDG